MSRYKIHTPDRVVAYGYDRPTCTYFMQIWDADDKEGPNVDRDCTGGELLELAEEYGVALPHQHARAAAMDLPF